MKQFINLFSTNKENTSLKNYVNVIFIRMKSNQI